MLKTASVFSLLGETVGVKIGTAVGDGPDWSLTSMFNATPVKVTRTVATTTPIHFLMREAGTRFAGDGAETGFSGKGRHLGCGEKTCVGRDPRSAGRPRRTAPQVRTPCTRELDAKPCVRGYSCSALRGGDAVAVRVRTVTGEEYAPPDTHEWGMGDDRREARSGGPLRGIPYHRCPTPGRKGRPSDRFTLARGSARHLCHCHSVRLCHPGRAGLRSLWHAASHEQRPAAADVTDRCGSLRVAGY